MFEYRLNQGTYYLFNTETEQIIDGMDEVAIAWFWFKDDDEVTFIKHGTPEKVTAYCRKKYAEYESIGATLKCVIGKFPVEELNKIISKSNYINQFLLKAGIEPRGYYCPPNILQIIGVKNKQVYSFLKK